MATVTLRFTKKNLEAIEPPVTGRDTYRDDASRHLHLRVTAKGARTFTLIRKVKGRVRYVALGEFPEVTPQQARRLAEEHSAALLKGEEPNVPRVEAMTFSELFSRYLEEYAKKNKRSWRDDELRFETHLAPWKRKKVADIDRKTVRALHSKLAEKCDRAAKGVQGGGPYAANRTLALIRKVFNWAINDLELPLGSNPAQGIKPHREESRERFLSAEELRAFWKALESEETPPIWKDFFRVALLTGARRANVEAMRWENIDFDSAVWSIPRDQSKNKKPLRVVLLPEAVEILRQRQAEASGPFVFSSPKSASGHVQEPRKAWLKICERAGLEGVRIHDLRRTLGSWQAATGASLQVIGKSLGHQNSKTTEIYSRLDLAPVRKSVTTAAAAMFEAIKGQAAHAGQEEVEPAAGSDMTDSGQTSPTKESPDDSDAASCDDAETEDTTSPVEDLEKTTAESSAPRNGTDSEERRRKNQFQKKLIEDFKRHSQS